MQLLQMYVCVFVCVTIVDIKLIWHRALPQSIHCLKVICSTGLVNSQPRPEIIGADAAGGRWGPGGILASLMRGSFVFVLPLFNLKRWQR